MTPDLQARIEKLARDLDDRLYREIFGSRAKDAAKMGTARIIAQSLTTLAEQIIAEKDAEAAEVRKERDDLLMENSTVDHETSECCDARIALQQLIEDAPNGWRKAAMLTQLKVLIDATTGHCALKDKLASLRERVRELEGELRSWVDSELPVDTAAEIRARLLLDKGAK